MVEDSFGTITEFGVALAGFSAVAIALSQEPGGLAPLDRFRALNLLTCALGAAFGATFVFIGAAFGANGPTLWSASSGGVTVVLLGCTAVPVLLAVRLSVVDRAQLSNSLWVLCIGGNLACALSLVANAIGFFGPSGPGPIIVSLVWLLLFSAILFVRILVNRPGSSEP